MSLLSLVKTGITIAGKFAVQHAPIISACLATVGVVSTGIAAYKAGKKASVLIKKAEDEKGSPLTTGEKIKTTCKTVIPVTIAAIITVAAIWTGQYAMGRKLKQACAFYSAALAAKDVQIEKLSSEVGEEIVKKVTKDTKKELAEEKAEKIFRSNTEVIDHGIVNDGLIFDPDGEVWIDIMSGQIFKATHDRVKNAVNKMIGVYNERGIVSTTEFYRWMQWPIECRPGVAEHLKYVEDYNRHGRGWEPDPVIDAKKTANGTVFSYIDLEPDAIYDDGSELPWF